MVLHLGHTLSGREVVLSGGDNPHLNISGQSGTGKSHLLKMLAAKAAEQGALVVALDYTSDFSDYEPPGNLRFRRIDVSSPDFSLNPLIGLHGQTANVRAQQLLAALHSAFRTGSRATVSLLHATTAYLTESESPTLDGLLAYIHEQEPSKGLDSALEPLELLVGLIHCGERLISIDLENPGLIVLDCSNIIDHSLLKILVELILQVLWTAHTSQQPPLILILDEAQQLHWGSGSMSIRILREGRKFGIAGWFSSQWLDHKDAAPALGQAATQIHFRPDEQHINKLARAICDRPSDIPQCQKVLRGLRRGQCLLQQANDRPLIVHVTS